MKVIASHASVPAAGEIKNGDRAVIRQEADCTLLSVIDGLGHGPGADSVSGAAADFLMTVDLSFSTLRIIEALHQSIAGTRGAAATLCILKNNNLSVCAVGNVEIRTGSVQLPLVASPGVLGARVAKFRVCDAPITKSSRLILFSDGISSRTRFDEMKHLTPEQCCKEVMDSARRDYDDSTILVADVEPSS